MANRSRKSSVVAATVNARKARRSLFTSPSQVSAYDRWASEVQQPGGNVLSRLLVGTALGTALGVGLAVMSPTPANATCTGTTTIVCTGTDPAGIGPYTDPLVTDITIVKDHVGANGSGDGVTFTATAAGKTMTVKADSASTIGFNYGIVPRDGMHVFSNQLNTAIVINNAAQIQAKNDGIYAKIHAGPGESKNSIVITNTGAIGTILNPVGGVGIGAYGKAWNVGANDPVMTTTVNNAAPIFSVGNSINQFDTANAAYNGYAKAGTYVTNSGHLTSTKADAIRAGSYASGFGPNSQAIAITTVDNSGPLNAAHHGIHAGAVANESFTGSIYGVQAGVATATVVINNSNAITSGWSSIVGYTTASANASSLVGLSTGGQAIASTTINNSGYLSTTGNNGVRGNANATANAYVNGFLLGGTAKGGTATATTTINNSGGIYSKNSDSIQGFAHSTADASSKYGNAQGGTAISVVTITNSGPVTSKNDGGVEGKSYATANASSLFGNAKGGTATATTTIMNTGIIKSYDEGLHNLSTADANAKAYGAKNTSTGGTATAISTVVNTANITSTGDGIEAESIARADANRYSSNQSDIAKGGIAIANTTVINSGPIVVGYIKGDTEKGIQAEATARAQAQANYSKAGVATGGTATATIVVINSNSVYSFKPAIFADTESHANAYGFTATGGTAVSKNTIINSGALTTGRYFDGNELVANAGIMTDAESHASAVGGAYGIKGGVVTGGRATSLNYITNSGPIVASGDGIHIDADSTANASGSNGFTTLVGGIAVAITQITNSGKVNSYKGHGINGDADSTASAFGVYSKGSVATGGTATSTLFITNSGQITALQGSGVTGAGDARANATGFVAKGGTATGTATVVNSGKITSDAGIYTNAHANANGNGSYSVGGTGTGGTATATANTTNSGQIIAISTPSDPDFPGFGIANTAHAYANGMGNVATGGTATSLSTVTNSGQILSSRVGIYAYSESVANARGSAFLGSAKAGTARATTNITNSGAITTMNGIGIFGKSYAYAVGTNGTYGYNGTGGKATAITTITNSGRVHTVGIKNDGIFGHTYADANGSLIGGTASASTTIINTATGVIITSGSNAQGIKANTVAKANGSSFFGFPGYAGSATATTDVTNAGAISTTGANSAGVAAYSRAFATGYTNATLAGPNSGKAVAITNVTNSGGINTKGSSSAGVYATSYALAGYYSGGVANATTNVVNSGRIVTMGSQSAGIMSSAYAFAGDITGGTATATTTVSNSGLIRTFSDHSPGISALSVAAGFQGHYVAPVTLGVTQFAAPPTGFGYLSYATTATATTTVNNSGTIKTFGDHSPGITALSVAYGSSPTTTAKTYVTNSGTILTYSGNSAGIAAGSIAVGDSTAITTVSNSGTITTSSYSSPGIFAFSTATSLNPLAGAYAYTTVNNSGTILTSGKNSPGVAAYATYFGAKGNATIVVNNSGLISTTGLYSPAVRAGIAMCDIASFGNCTPTGNADPSITINNSGRMEAIGFPYTAIQTFGAPTTINNTGVVYGNVELTSFNDTFNNNKGGTWIMKGDSNFGAGVDVVNNGGVVRMVNNQGKYNESGIITGDFHSAGVGTGVVVNSNVPPITGYKFHTVTVQGLENWNNFSGAPNAVNGVNTGGLITMVNGQPNQQIVLSGNFNGTATGAGNSRLAVDAFLGAPGSTADLLSVKGNVTGNTHIIVNDTNPGLGAYNPIGIPVVIVGGNTVVGNFDLAGGAIHKGLFDYDLLLRPDKVWVLVSGPNQAANELPRLVTAAQNVWDRSSGMWLDRTADLRSAFLAGPAVCGGAGADLPVKGARPICNTDTSGVAVWMNGLGDWSKSRGDAFNSVTGARFGVGYDQSVYGFQAGLDWASSRRGPSAWIFGVTAGYLNSKASFDSSTSARFEGGSAGVYATYLNRGFYVDALFMANFLTMNYANPLLNAQFAGNGISHSRVNSYGGHIDAGYKFAMPGNWYVEPQAAIQYVTSQFDNNTAFAGTPVNLDGDAFKGRVGARVGTTYMGNGFKWEPSVTASVWHRFTGDNFATISSGGANLDLVDANQTKTYGEIGGALNMFHVGSVWSGFVKGDYRFGDNYSGGSVKGGVRAQF